MINTKKVIKNFIGDSIGWKDPDSDGIVNAEDCQPLNKKKQGYLHDLGYSQLKRMQGNIPNNQRQYDRI